MMCFYLKVQETHNNAVFSHLHQIQILRHLWRGGYKYIVNTILSFLLGLLAALFRCFQSNLSNPVQVQNTNNSTKTPTVDLWGMDTASNFRFRKYSAGIFKPYYSYHISSFLFTSLVLCILLRHSKQLRRRDSAFRMWTTV